MGLFNGEWDCCTPIERVPRKLSGYAKGQPITGLCFTEENKNLLKVHLL